MKLRCQTRRAETPKASRGRGLGRGIPLPSRLWGLMSVCVVSSPAGVVGRNDFYRIRRPKTHLDLKQSTSARKLAVGAIKRVKIRYWAVLIPE